MKKRTAFDGLSTNKDISERYERIRKRNDVLLKKWGSLNSKFQFPQNPLILIIGPGTGKSDKDIITKVFHDAKLETIDFEGNGFTCIDSWLRYCLKKGGQLNEGQYDGVVAQQILQHTTDWRSFFYVLNRILKDEGIFVFDSFDAPIFRAVQGQTFSVTTDSISDNWEKFFLTEYRKREFNEGIFWDPEFVSNIPERLGSLLSLFGFDKVDTGNEISANLKISCDDLKQSFLNKEYGPLFWGSYNNSEVSSEPQTIPTEEWEGEVKYQLHVYKKKISQQDNFLDLLNNIRMLNNRAVLRLDTHLRYDISVQAVMGNDREHFEERLLLSYIQSLLFAGAVHCRTDLFLPFLGEIKTTQPSLKIVYPKKQHALISRQNYSKVNCIFSHHLSIICEEHNQSFTEFLAKEIGRPVTLIFQLACIESPTVTINDCDFGLLIEFKFPKTWGITINCSHDSKEPVSEEPQGRIFSHYLYINLDTFSKEHGNNGKNYGKNDKEQRVFIIKNSLLTAFKQSNILDRLCENTPFLNTSSVV